MTALALTALLGLTAASCAPQKEGSVGLLYRVTGGKNQMVLLGSIHAGSKSMYPMGAHVLDALESADILAFECDTQSAEAQAVYADMMRSPEGERLSDQVSAETFSMIEQAAEAAGMRMETLEGLMPWAAMSLLNTQATAALLGARSAKAASDLGVERQIAKLGGEKPVVWLQSTRDELEVLAGFSPELQEYLLQSACRLLIDPSGATGMDAAMNQWPDWWAEGDADAFAQVYQEGMEQERNAALAQEYHRALVTERNARMARRMAQWLEAGEGQSYFVTLGLLHLVLPGDSVIAELERMGYQVERVLPAA